jgi:hypothetical protein
MKRCANYITLGRNGKPTGARSVARTPNLELLKRKKKNASMRY